MTFQSAKENDFVKFRKQFLKNKELIAGLKSRGFEISTFEKNDDNNCTFIKPGIGGNHIYLHISPWEKGSFQCGIIIGSLSVTDYYYRLSLFLDQWQIPANMPFGVLAVDLHWLRWNANPEIARIVDIGYGLSAGETLRDFFSDLDSVGQAFINDVATAPQLANFLMGLSVYPIRVKWGGKPRSSEPFIFAAILFIEAGDTLAACTALDRGLVEYETPEPVAEWQQRKIKQFRERKALLTEFISINERQ